MGFARSEDFEDEGDVRQYEQHEADHTHRSANDDDERPSRELLGSCVGGVSRVRVPEGRGDGEFAALLFQSLWFGQESPRLVSIRATRRDRQSGFPPNGG